MRIAREFCAILLANAKGLRFAHVMLRLSTLLLMTLLWTAPAMARDSLGVFERWGAFRDSAVPRCYAIAEPAASGARTGSNWRPFVSIGNWPRRGVRGQLHVRLSRQRAPASSVTLVIADQLFPLVAGSADAWAPDRQRDAAIIAAMRSASSMSIAATDRAGRGFSDTYALRGAATAMDAAALGCAG
jgi:hypothetical protein